jgi:hypothetical protein
MTQHRPGAAGENGGHPAAFVAEDRVTNRVHPTVHEMQPAVRKSQLDRTSAKADGPQLGPGDDPVLPSRQVRQHPVQRSFFDLTPTMGAKSKSVGHACDRGSRKRTGVS